MGWLGWLRGGSEELGFDDLVKRVAEAIAKLARYAERGRVAFPADVTVRIAVGEGSVDLIRGFVEKPELDAAVGAALANTADCAPDALPVREYEVVAANTTAITVREGSPRVWQLEVDGGDLSGRVLSLPAGRKEARFGRGEWHGADQHVRNDLVVSESSEFVSRRAGRLTHVGHQLEVEALDQEDSLFVCRPSGEAFRPARTAKGRAALREGDVIELRDGLGRAVRLIVRRHRVEESDDGPDA